MANHSHSHDHENFDPGVLYGEQWVQDLIHQLQEYFKTNCTWLGLETGKKQRVLDYACGDGTVSAALATVCSDTIFRGIDVHPAQVGRFNTTSRKLLGEDQSRMFAIEGDLSNPSQVLEEADWSDFDAAIISMALHHVDDPVDILRRLGKRVKKGGYIIVADWLQGLPVPESSQGAAQHKPYHHEHNHDPSQTIKTIGGQRIWFGFAADGVEGCMKAAGLTDVEIRLDPKISRLPENLGGDKQAFYAKASVM